MHVLEVARPSPALGFAVLRRRAAEELREDIAEPAAARLRCAAPPPAAPAACSGEVIGEIEAAEIHAGPRGPAPPGAGPAPGNRSPNRSRTGRTSAASWGRSGCRRLPGRS